MFVVKFTCPSLPGLEPNNVPVLAQQGKTPLISEPVISKHLIGPASTGCAVAQSIWLGSNRFSPFIFMLATTRSSVLACSSSSSRKRVCVDTTCGNTSPAFASSRVLIRPPNESKLCFFSIIICRELPEIPSDAEGEETSVHRDARGRLHLQYLGALLA